VGFEPVISSFQGSSPGTHRQEAPASQNPAKPLTISPSPKRPSLCRRIVVAEAAKAFGRVFEGVESEPHAVQLFQACQKI